MIDRKKNLKHRRKSDEETKEEREKRMRELIDEKARNAPQDDADRRCYYKCIGLILLGIIATVCIYYWPSNDVADQRRLQAAERQRARTGGLKAAAMQLFYRIDGEVRELEMPADATVADVIAAAELTPGTQLTYQGTALRPEQTLADAGVGAEALLVVVVVAKHFVAGDGSCVTFGDSMDVATFSPECSEYIKIAGLDEKSAKIRLIGADHAYQHYGGDHGLSVGVRFWSETVPDKHIDTVYTESGGIFKVSKNTPDWNTGTQDLIAEKDEIKNDDVIVVSYEIIDSEAIANTAKVTFRFANGESVEVPVDITGFGSGDPEIFIETFCVKPIIAKLE